jgi:hypothetical protein
MLFAGETDPFARVGALIGTILAAAIVALIGWLVAHGSGLV